MKLTVVGTGYVGLVTGTCMAETGVEVLCVDNNVDKVNTMSEGKLPIYEPHLDQLFQRNILSGRLRFSTNLKEGLDHSDIIMLALPTPDCGNGFADLSYVLKVSEAIGQQMDSYKVIVNKSTVPVGTADKVREVVKEQTDIAFDVVSNPEFLREGFAVEDFMKPERIIIGSQSERAVDLMKQLYRPFVRSGNPILVMDEKSSELTKYAANSFLATKITFMNEIANFCEKVGADVDMVRRGVGTDSRIGKRFLFPGIGYGGSCFPKDVKALFYSGQEVDYNFNILEAVIKTNDHQRTILLPRLDAFFKGQLKGKTIAIWGLAFKPETDDIREAPALLMIDELLKLGAKIQVHDPEAMTNVEKIYQSKIDYCQNIYEAVNGADALVICTEWSIFRSPDFSRIKSLMAYPAIFDGRNLYDTITLQEEGFYYSSIGRALVQPQ